MKVCYVFQDQYPWDVRAEKITDSLVAHGIEIHIVSRNRDGLPRSQWLNQRLCVHRLPGEYHPFIRKVINFPAFFSPFWLKALYSVTKEVIPAVIIVRDLPLAPAALLIGHLYSVPVVMDMAENYPAMIRDTWTYGEIRPIDLVVRNPFLLKVMEKMILPRLDGILAVSTSSAERIIRLGVGRDRVFVVSNTPRLANLKLGGSTKRKSLVRHLSNYILLYVGGLEETRGLEIVVRALPSVVREIPSLLFVIVGSGTSEMRLRKIAADLGVAKNMLLLGWMEPHLIPLVIQECDIGIVPHYVTEHTDTTVPNKIFDYMVHRKPVVVTHARSLKEIVDSNQCGRVYIDKDPACLAQILLELRSEILRKSLGESGFQAVQNRFNWNEDEKVLMSSIVRFAPFLN